MIFWAELTVVVRIVDASSSDSSEDGSIYFVVAVYHFEMLFQLLEDIRNANQVAGVAS